MYSFVQYVFSIIKGNSTGVLDESKNCSEKRPRTQPQRYRH